MTPELRSAIVRTASSIGVDPVDLATVMSYETGGTFDPWKRGPTTRWGTHRGLIQWGEPQARQYGVTRDTPVGAQVEAAGRYLKDRGVRPGASLLEIYSAINAGGVGEEYFDRSDSAAGGAPGTVRDKVQNQMAGHRQKALRLIGGEGVAAPQYTSSGQRGQAGTTPDGTPVMQAGAVAEVQDPDILTAFGIGTAPKAMPTAKDVVVPMDAAPVTGQPTPVTSRYDVVTDPDILGAFDGAPAGRTTPDEVRSDPNRVMTAGGQFKTGFTSDIEEKIRVAAQSIYPNEPLEESTKRFGIVNGELVHQADDGNIYRASIPNELKNALSFAGPALPIAAGTATGILTAPMALGTSGAGLPASMALTGGAGMAAEAGRQALGDLMLGDASTKSLNMGSIAQEGAINALGQGIGAGIGQLATRGAVRDIDRMNKPRTLRQYQEAKAKGIDITPGEASGLPSMKAQQNLLANDFRTADQMSDFYSKRNTQVMKAWDGFLDGISKAADGEDVARSVRDAAKGVIDDVIRARQQAAAPLYQKAYSATAPLTDDLANLLERPAIRKAAKSAYEMMENAGKSPQRFLDIAEDGAIKVKRAPTIEEWNFIKFGLDDLIETNKNPLTGKLTPQGRIYQGLKGEMLDELDRLVPEYGQARAIFETGSEAVDNTLESAIKRMADVKDPDILRETRILFEPGTRSPNMIRKLGNSIASKDPQAWQAVKRLYLNDEVTRALRVTQTGEVTSPAGKIYKTFANDKVMQNIKATLNPQEMEAFDGLMKVYRTIAGAQERNSWTAFMQAMQKDAQDSARPVWAKGLRNLNPAQALRSVDEWATERNLSKHAETVAELITSGDPAVIDKLKELRRLSPTSKRGVVLVGQLLSQTSAFGAKSVLEPQNYDPDQQPN